MRVKQQCLTFAIGAALLLAGCERQNLNLRARMDESMATLGVRPFYPLRETPRLGSLYIFDTDAYFNEARIPAHHDTYIHVSDDLAWELERRRQNVMASRNRFIKTSPEPSDKKMIALGNGTTPSAFVQLNDRRDDVNTPLQPAPNPSGELSHQPLSLAGMPGYELASIEQFSVSGVVPQAFQSFLGALGWRSTRHVKVEAVGVEVAEVPLEDLLATVRQACDSGTVPILQSETGNHILARAIGQLDALRQERSIAHRRSFWTMGIPTKDYVNPQLMLMRRVFYLRGLRFTIDDSQTTSALLQAASNASLPKAAATPGATPQTVTAPTVTVVTPPSPGAAPGPMGLTAELQSQLNDLKAQMDALKTSQNIQVATSYARATAVGVELTQVFDRPMAFGFEPVAFSVNWGYAPEGGIAVGPTIRRTDNRSTEGIERVCSWARPART